MKDFHIRLLEAREIECRINQISKKGTGLSLLLYKDARVDMTILDETFGAMNWQRHHTRDNANCTISVWDDDKKCWVGKEDVGTESNAEAVKGLASDSFKRAGVNWGIGRELYTAPFIWIDKANCNLTSDNGHIRCYDAFEVKDIGYNEHREINRLVIVNSKTKAVVYEYGTGGRKSQLPANAPKVTGGNIPDVPATAEQIEYIKGATTDDEYVKYMQEFGADLEALSEADARRVIKEIDDNHNSGLVKCERCESAITGVALPDGTTMTASELIAKSKLTYYGVYCFECMKQLKKEQQLKKARKAG